ncbi:uncharacterized protein IAS62_003028 [Cryptococcus decagattii]|uniref:Uncharacterized protein n=1 Tax=Cryptococcus decagattii TaxID=1859122 RepID=A0ABZ2AT57_9TREE
MRLSLSDPLETSTHHSTTLQVGKAELDKAEIAEMVDDGHHVSTVGMMTAPEGLCITKARTCFEANVRAVHGSNNGGSCNAPRTNEICETPLGCIRPVDDILRIFDNGGHGTVMPFIDSANYLRQASALAFVDSTKNYPETHLVISCVTFVLMVYRFCNGYDTGILMEV